MKSCTLLLLAVTLVVMVVDEVIGACCIADRCGRCDDNTRGTPYCGYDRCNWVGCGCDCRTGGCRRKRSSPEHRVNPAEIFLAVDINGDSMVDKEEFDQSAKAVTMSPNVAKGLSEEEFLMKEFEKTDKNGDGKISPGEFDNDLK